MNALPITYRDLWNAAERERFAAEAWSGVLAVEGKRAEAAVHARRAAVFERLCEVVRRCESDAILRARMADLKRIERAQHAAEAAEAANGAGAI